MQRNGLYDVSEVVGLNDYKVKVKGKTRSTMPTYLRSALNKISQVQQSTKK